MHYVGMRSHYEIIREAGAEVLAEALDVSVNTVRAWMQRSSIPSENWKPIVALGKTSFDELAEHVPKPPTRRAAA